MNLIKKCLMYLKLEGISYTLKKITHKVYKEIKKLPKLIYEKLYAKKVINQLKDKINEKDIFIIIPCIDWSIPLYQRPHQIASELAKRDNSLILFIPDQYQYDNFAIYKPINDNLWLFSYRLVKKLDMLLENANRKIVFMSWTRQANLIEKFHYDKLVYEYIDEMSLFYYYNEQMEQMHRKLMKQADLTVCTAKKLYNKAKKVTDKVILSENAGDYTFFKNNRNCPIAPVLANKINEYECIIGYYGCLAYWFDYSTICEVAKKRKKWLFVLIGYEFDHTSDVLKTGEFENIIQITSQPYGKLPSYVSAFDIQTIPFVINEVTKSTSPVKLFEYMASGKPIITSKLPECLRYKSVFTYETVDDFIKLVEQIRKLENSDVYYETLEQEALENTWTARVHNILKYLNI